MWKSPTKFGMTHVVVVDEKIYALGGSDEPYPSIEVYDVATNQWTIGPTYPSTRPIAAATVIDGTLYTLSICGTGCVQPTLFSYDPTSALWTELASYPSPHTVGDCVVLHKNLYCLDGDSSGIGYRYSPGSNRWTRIANMPAMRIGGYLTVSNNMLLVVGASDVLGPSLLYLLSYDPLANTWTIRPETAQRRNGATSACGFYWIGGIVNFDTWQTAAGARLRGLYPCGPIDHVPWLGTQQSSTVIAANTTNGVSLGFDASLPQFSAPGIYTATLPIITSDRVGENVVTLPVKMTVLPPGAAQLQGQVTGWDSCAVATAPLHGTIVRVSDAQGSTWNIRADQDGRYRLVLPEWHLPLTVTTTHPGYRSRQFAYTGPLLTAMEVNPRLYNAGLCVSTSSTVAGTATTFSVNLPWAAAASYTWDFGDGTTGSGAQATHTYPMAGTYTINVTALVEDEEISQRFQVVITPDSTIPPGFTIYLPGVLR